MRLLKVIVMENFGKKISTNKIKLKSFETSKGCNAGNMDAIPRKEKVDF